MRPVSRELEHERARFGRYGVCKGLLVIAPSSSDSSEDREEGLMCPELSPLCLESLVGTLRFVPVVWKECGALQCSASGFHQPATPQLLRGSSLWQAHDSHPVSATPTTPSKHNRSSQSFHGIATVRYGIEHYVNRAQGSFRHRKLRQVTGTTPSPLRLPVASCHRSSLLPAALCIDNQFHASFLRRWSEA